MNREGPTSELLGADPDSAWERWRRRRWPVGEGAGGFGTSNGIIPLQMRAMTKVMIPAPPVTAAPSVRKTAEWGSTGRGGRAIADGSGSIVRGARRGGTPRDKNFNIGGTSHGRRAGNVQAVGRAEGGRVDSERGDRGAAGGAQKMTCSRVKCAAAPSGLQHHNRPLVLPAGGVKLESPVVKGAGVVKHEAASPRGSSHNGITALVPQARWCKGLGTWSCHTCIL